MRKILILIVLSQFHHILNSQSPTHHNQSLEDLKNWQVKGMSRSAIRLNDAYLARDFLNEWHKREPENAKVRLLLAEFLFQSRDYQRAADLFKSLWDSNPVIYSQAGYHLSLIYKMNGEYEQAMKILQTLRRGTKKSKGNDYSRNRLDTEIMGCQMGIASRDTIVKTEVLRLNETINSPYIEFSPLLTSDSSFVYGSIAYDSLMYFELDKPYSAKRFFLEARKRDGVWIGGFDPPTPFVNQPSFDTGRGVFSLDRKRFYSVNCSVDRNGRSICHLYVSVLRANGWSKPLKLSKHINHPRYSSTHPSVGTCFNSSLEIIYFVSERHGGAGKKDIWFSVYNKTDDTYSKAENAGIFINTDQDEMTPYFDLPSHKLYFSSNGWPSMGGLDMFYSKGDMATWERPVNVGVPINSSYDDLNLVQNQSAKFGLFTSNRPGSFSNLNQACCDDLYAFIETESPRVLITGKLVAEDIIRKSGIFNLATEDSTQLENTGTLSNQMVTVQTVRDSSSSFVLQEIQTNAAGEFQIWVDPGMEYKVTVDNPLLINKNFSFSTKDAKRDETVDVSTISLTSVSQKSIVIENIYYEFNQSELTSKAKETLDSTLMVLLTRYPTLQVEIASHTDNIGEEKYNQRLSERRANSVVQYLISKGIIRKRLTAKGYGESAPISPNQNNDGSDNSEGRNKNRRTEFKIIGINH